ncbi:hypothetical protein B0H19DRAFT_1271318 [Mycena capillaripes]|nr:hypothetical protein B0H19DRAFT_1271318 [Mycena capillaripes]
MLNKFISSALLFVVLIQGAMGAPSPIACGGPNEPACPAITPCDPACLETQFCCHTLGNICLAAGSECPIIG